MRRKHGGETPGDGQELDDQKGLHDSLGLYETICKLAEPYQVNEASLFTLEDLVNTVFLQVAEMDNPYEGLGKRVRNAAIRAYRVKYPRHSTARFTAEELELYSRNLLVNVDTENEDDYSVIESLRGLFKLLNYIEIGE